MRCRSASTTGETTLMRSRLVILVALVIAAAAVVVAVHRFAAASPGSGSAAGALPPNLTSYLGVYEAGPPKSYQPIANFTSAVGKQPNLVGYYSGWGEAFQASFAETVHRHGAATILQWDPTLASV